MWRCSFSRRPAADPLTQPLPSTALPRGCDLPAFPLMVICIHKERINISNWFSLWLHVNELSNDCKLKADNANLMAFWCCFYALIQLKQPNKMTRVRRCFLGDDYGLQHSGVDGSNSKVEKIGRLIVVGTYLNIGNNWNGWCTDTMPLLASSLNGELLWTKQSDKFQKVFCSRLQSIRWWLNFSTFH